MSDSVKNVAPPVLVIVVDPTENEGRTPQQTEERYRVLLAAVNDIVISYGGLGVRVLPANTVQVDPNDVSGLFDSESGVD